jgi:carbon-monoxide dehydrogenase iron sulfur subunit
MVLKPITVRAQVCSGCRSCETACVFRREGLIGTSASRIRIVKDEAEGADLPRLCRLCADPACIPACPNGALERDRERGTVRLDEALCQACGECLTACPFGSLFQDPRDGTPLICDLCGGDPACVEICTTGALVFEA